MYTQGGADFGSMLSILTAIRLPSSKVRQFLPSKPSYTKITPAKRKFKGMRVCQTQNWIYCIDLTYVLVNLDNDDVEYFLDCQDLLDGTVDTRRMKTNAPKKRFKLLRKRNTKRNQTMKMWVDKRTDCAGEFEKTRSAEGIQIHSSMIETKVAFVERKIRFLKKNIFIITGSLWIQVHSESVSVSQNWYQRKSRIPNFCPFCTENHFERLENWSLRFQTEFASRNKNYSSRSVLSHSLLKMFVKMFQFIPTMRVKDELDEITRVEFDQKELIKVF